MFLGRGGMGRFMLGRGKWLWLVEDGMGDDMWGDGSDGMGNGSLWVACGMKDKDGEGILQSSWMDFWDFDFGQG